MKKDLESIKKLNKGELHVHLNGLVSCGTIKRILGEENIKIPKGFNIEKDLMRVSPAESLQQYLKPWDVLRLIPKERKNLSLIIEDAFFNLKKENVKFVELRHSVIYLATLNAVKVETALCWLLEDIQAVSNKYQITAGLILTIPRGDYAGHHLHELLSAYKNLGCPKGIIGLDLAGNENTSISNDLGLAFIDAKHSFGLKITIHAGETGNDHNIRQAVMEFGADRIGHGTAAGKNLRIMDLLREKDICVEICPVSNRLTGAVKETEIHPVRHFIEHEVPFVICSDNPGIHGLSISDDYYSFLVETGDKKALENMFSLQQKYSFIEGI